MEYQHKLSVEDQKIAKGLLLQNEDNWNYSVEEQKAKTFALKNEDLEISSSKDQISPLITVKHDHARIMSWRHLSVDRIKYHNK